MENATEILSRLTNVEENQGTSRRKLDEVLEVVGRIEVCITGDPSHGIEGFVQKHAIQSLAITAIDKRVVSLENDRWYQRGLAAAAGLGAMIVWEMVKIYVLHAPP